MFLQDFIAERNIKQSAASMYIKRHEEEFDGHISIKEGKSWLDEIAIELLSKKYPVLPVDDVWTPAAKQKYDELAEELRETNKEVRQLNAENRELRQFEMKYRALETQQQLLIEEAVMKKDKEIGILEGFLQDAKNNIADQQNEIDQLKEEIKNKKPSLEEFKQLVADYKKNTPWYERLRDHVVISKISREINKED